MRRFMRKRSLAALALLVAAGAPRHLGAQAPDPNAPVNYVASIKRSPSPGGGQIRIAPGLVSVSGVPIRTLIRQAFGPIQDSQLVGGPGWITSDRFDIEARLEGPPSPTAINSMLRQMLADRFGLQVHTESRELPVFDLVLARSDRRLGTALQPSSPECAAQLEAGARGRGGPGDGRGGPGDGRGAPPLARGIPPAGGPGRGPGGPGPLAFDGPAPCGSRGAGPGRFRAGGTTMAAFASNLGQFAQRVVRDRTELAGYYDVQLTYTPSQDQLPQGPPPPGVEPPAIDPNGPTLFTALQEQLGLKLEAARGPVDVIVIDAISAPTEN